MDNNYYIFCKKHMDWVLSHTPFQYKGSQEDWVKGFMYRIVELEKEEDYEGAKAIKDSIKDYLNQFLSDSEKITDDYVLNLLTPNNK